MRLVKCLAVLFPATIFLLAACGGAPSSVTQPTKTPAANSSAPTNTTPTPAETTAGANFITSNLVVTPEAAKPGERVMVGVTVTNTGTEQGTYTLLVKDHDGKMLGTKDVTLAGGAKEDVSIHISINTTGTHMVMVEKLYKNLVIKQDAAAAVAPAANNTQPAQPNQPVARPPAGPTGFTVLKVEVDPTMPDVGEDCILAVTVKNNGTQQGTYKIEVKIEGNTVATKDVTLAAGETKAENVPFKAPNKEGNFKVSVGDQMVGMSVMAM